MCMSVKQRERKRAVNDLLEWIRSKCNLAEDKTVPKPGLLAKYSYESGITLRTLSEYFGILYTSKLVSQRYFEEDHEWRYYVPEVGS